MATSAILFVLFALAGQGSAPLPQVDNLAAAKALYASGSYEDALGRLDAGYSDGTADEVDQYRSLCLLALGRTAEAQRSLEVLVRRSPLFKMSEADVSPRVVSLFHDVRKRLLPAVVRDLYTKAKTNFDQKVYATAKLQLTDLVALIGDEDIADQAALADLKMLGEGFLKLTDVELEAAAKAAAAAAAKAAIPPPSPPAEKIYAAEDRDVTPPVDVNCPLPDWQPVLTPGALARDNRGFLRLVIDERGKVEQASMVTSVHPSYDKLLLAVAKDWEFKPAKKNGQPVKYAKVISIVLKAK